MLIEDANHLAKFQPRKVDCRYEFHRQLCEHQTTECDKDLHSAPYENLPILSDRLLSPMPYR